MKRETIGTLALLAFVAIASVITLTGCSKKNSGNVQTAENPYGYENLAELKVSAGDWTFVAREKGWLKEKFEQYGIKVSLVQGTTGNEAQLMARGDLHFATRMIYPYLLYRIQGADLTAVFVSKHPEPKIANILVLKDSPIQTFDELKNKKIASWRAGCSYIVLYELAESRDWVQGKDWTYVNIPSGEQKNALLSREIDAVSGHLLGDVAQLIVGDFARIVANPAEDSVYIKGGGVQVIFAPTAFAKDYPNITKELIALELKTEQWMLANLDEASKLVEGITRVPADVSKLAWTTMGTTWEASELDLGTIIAEANVMQDWLVEHGDIEAGKRIDSARLFDSQYFR